MTKTTTASEKGFNVTFFAKSRREWDAFKALALINDQSASERLRVLISRDLKRAKK